MPGNGTFNLTAIWRALGIKNPETSLRESVQPVILVGDFSQLTPLHRPPTAHYGGNIAAVAGERPIVQVTSRATGGTLIGTFRNDSVQTFFYSQGAVQTGLTAVAPNPILAGRENMVMDSLVEKGTVPANPGDQTNSPYTDENSPYLMSRYPMLMFPGQTVFFWVNTNNLAINAWMLELVDLPASQPPEA